MILIQHKIREYWDMFDRKQSPETDHKVRTTDQPKEGRITEAGQGTRYQHCNKKKKFFKKFLIYYWRLFAGWVMWL